MQGFKHYDTIWHLALSSVNMSQKTLLDSTSTGDTIMMRALCSHYFRPKLSQLVTDLNMNSYNAYKSIFKQFQKLPSSITE